MTTRASSAARNLPNPPMKAIKLLCVASLLAGTATLAVAGPGTDYWLSRQKLKKERAPAQSAAPVQTCATPCGCGGAKS